MPYTVIHPLFGQGLKVSVTRKDGAATASCTAAGRFDIKFPGTLQTVISASVTVRVFVEPVPIEGSTAPPLKGRWQNTKVIVPARLVIRTPDGVVFNAREVTLADLKRFRDARGLTHGRWSFTIDGQTDPIEEEPTSVQVTTGGGRFTLGLIELVTSQSAPPLVTDTLDAGVRQRYTFDLFRVGTLNASVKPIISLPSSGGERLLRLIDPDGVPVAPPSSHLSHPITLATLARSRDAQGQPRLWTLDVLPVFSTPRKGERHTVAASVTTSARIGVRALNERIERLLGPRGGKLEIFAEVLGPEALVRMKILDPETAGTIDMHGLLDGVIESVRQIPGVDKDIRVGAVYTLARHSRDLGFGFKLALSGVKVGAIDIALGASEQIQPPVPALKIAVQIAGTAIIEFRGFRLATVRVRDGRVRLEAGLRLDGNGNFAPAIWIEPDRIDIDLHWSAALAAGVLTGPLILQGAGAIGEIILNHLDAMLSPTLERVAAKALGRAKFVLAMVLGDDFTYRALRLDGDDLVFDYDAPLEPDNKPTPGFTPIIGRAATQLGPDAWRLTPPSLGDTWAAGNLATKVDHIVVVMMENRSFDHVLGWRAQLAEGPPSDGLTPELIAFLGGKFAGGKTFPVRRLAEVDGIPRNVAGRRTAFPRSVGHELADVTQQLSRRLKTPAGRVIISPEGFVLNFAERVGNLQPEDVLGFHDDFDLPFFAHLVDHYAWCERYYCSHAGPTMPNRMLSLTGDLQHDRTGAPILDNNDSDNFSLSRATTIFDLLTRRGVSWRVYESFPSVTMLRMFARWATDNTNIVDFSRLKIDVEAGTLPALAVVEPAMHHFPQNDDHPVADMYRGQLFLKSVYDTLRSRPEVWRKTLLVITYDEHGGFYDHVVPPLAEARSQPLAAGGGATVPGGGAPLVPASVTTRYGVRVPTFVVSPWVPPGKGPDIVLDHCSILKTILARFCAAGQPFLSDRVHASHSFDAFLSAAEPRLQVPPAPDLPGLNDPPTPHRRIETPVLSRKQMRAGNADFHELTGMIGRLLGR